MTALPPPAWHLRAAARQPPRRRPEVVALVAMDIGAVLLCLVAVVRPPSPHAPVVLDAIAVVAGLVLVAVLLAQGSRVRGAVVAVNVVAYVGLAAAIVAEAGTGAGAASASMSFLFVALYVAVFFPRVASRACSTVVVAVSGVSLWLSEPVGNPLTIWFPLVLAIVVSTEMLSMLLAEMRRLTVTDALTGVLNRSGFEEQAVRERAVAARTGEPLSLVVIDINDFKSVNDRYGHAVGDALLVDITAEWGATLRARDVVGRRGGDEFALLLPGTTEDQARTLAARLHASSAYDWSYGVSCLRSDGDIDHCLARADQEMYEQKRRSTGPVGSDR